MHDYKSILPGVTPLKIEWEPETALYKVVRPDGAVIYRFDDYFKAAAYIREYNAKELLMA